MTYYQFASDDNQPYGSCLIFQTDEHSSSWFCGRIGWYWQACFPGCIPDGDPIGPFDTEEEAMADANVYRGES